MAKHKKPVPTPTIAARIARCREDMARRKTEAYLITQHMDSYYLTGFTGEDSAILVTPGAVHVISDSRFDEAINQECPA